MHPYAALACFALVHWFRGGGQRWLWLSALMAGLAPAVKLSGAFIPALLCFAVLLRPAPPARRLSDAFGFGLLALMMVAPWLLKTWLHTGNPVTPYLFSLLGAREWTLSAARQSTGMFHDFGMGRGLGAILLLPWNVTMHSTAFGGGNIGPIVLAGLPTLLLVRPLPWAIRASLLFLAGYLAIWFMVVQEVRFLVPVLPILSLALAHGLAAWAGSGRLARAVVAAALLVTGAANLLLLGTNFARPPGSVPPSKSLAVILGRESRADYLRRVERNYPFIEIVNGAIPADSRVLLLGMSEAYYLVPDYVRGFPVEQPLFDPHALPDQAAISRRVRELAVTHVLIDRNVTAAHGLPHFDHPAAPRHYAPALLAYARDELQLVVAAHGMELYAVPGAGPP